MPSSGKVDGYSVEFSICLQTLYQLCARGRSENRLPAKAAGIAAKHPVPRRVWQAPKILPELL
jgi:hypothetical protein